VLLLSNYYEIMGVPRGASGDDVKRAYRKMALKFHPDKNPNVPRAEEAFKHISRANVVLTDPQRRAFYDRTGRDPDAQPGAGGGGGGGGGAPGGGMGFRGPGGVYYDEANLFDVFFGGRGVHRGPQQRGGARQPDQPVNPLAQMLQLLPLLMIMLTLFSSSMVSPPRPEFSFGKEEQYGKCCTLPSSARSGWQPSAELAACV
jgi:DnaJ-class molecular chaperone